jgi:aspartate aminotransferase-like enzyme
MVFNTLPSSRAGSYFFDNKKAGPVWSKKNLKTHRHPVTSTVDRFAQTANFLHAGRKEGFSEI